MKYITLLWLQLALLTLFNSCKKDDAQPQSIANVVVNGDFETSPGQDWLSSVNRVSTVKPNNYTVDYTTEAATSPSHSIKVSCNAAFNDSTYQLVQQVLYTTGSSIPAGAKVITVPVGAKLTMKAKIKTANVQGNGISIAITGYHDATKNYTSAFYTSTEGKISITGTNDFKEYSITFDSLPANTRVIDVLIFFLPNTTGTAYYDDVSLSVN